MRRATTTRTCTRQGFLCRTRLFSRANGRRTIVLSDLEIDRARKQAKADEIVSFSQVEREVQGTQKKVPPFEKVMSHFLRKRGVRSAVVPANFPLGYAEELATQKIRVHATNGLFWPEREAKSEDELRQMRGALAITEKGLARAMEVLAASNGQGRGSWSGRTLTSETCAPKSIRQFCAPEDLRRTRSSPVVTGAIRDSSDR